MSSAPAASATSINCSSVDLAFSILNTPFLANIHPARDPHTYLLVFKQSVRGLEVGAPVIMNGITIGEVTTINPQFDAKTVEFSVPVTVSVDPIRYGVRFLNLPEGGNRTDNNQQVMNTLVAHGLRGQLKKGNLISGSLYVSIDLVPGAPPESVDWSKSPVQLPTLSGKLEEIEDSVASLLKNLDQTVVTARGTLTNADRLLDNAGTLIGPDSVMNAELLNLLQQGGGAARSLRVLADYLERHPEALIRGKTGAAKP